MNEKWFSLSVGEIEKKLKTNAASGLTRKAARSAWYRDNSSGKRKNSLFIRKSKPISKMIGEIFADFALVILLLAALFSVLLDEGSVGIAVVAIATINLIISFAIYFISQRTMEQMNLYFMPTAKVIRGGKLYRVSFENIVVGDVIILEHGDIVPADSRLVTSDKLTVAMRLEKNKYVPLQKQAQGVVSPDENDPTRMINILHAGSVIEEGSARAVVYATGRYTYLGARTGGVPVLYSDNTPKELKKMKKICSQVNMYSMLCILPFSVISVILSYMSSGNSTLSTAFLTALAICASSMTQLCTTICKVFFVKKIKDISTDKDSAVIRTTEAFDNLCDIKYLFMLDGSAVTDGILHFDTAFTLDGELKNYDNVTPTLKIFFESVSLYNHAQGNALSVGLNDLPDRFKLGIDEFLSRTGTDTEALKIRYSINAYIPGTINAPIDRIYCADKGNKKIIEVSCSPDIVSTCSYVALGGRVQPLTSIAADKLKHTHSIHSSRGKTVLSFAISPNADSNNKVFLGAVVLREGIDKRAFSSISTLEKNGVRVISFCDDDAKSPHIPTELHRTVCAYKEDFEKNQLPLTYKFGEIDTYYGLGQDDILQLLSFAHAQKQSVGVLAFSDGAPKVIEQADVFISCAPIINPLSAKSEQELYTLEKQGVASSSSCIQTVKFESDILIPRPNGKRGGVSSLVRLLTTAKISYRNLSSFFKYTLAAQFLRILTAGLPTVFGKQVLDARHILLCGFLFDLFVLLMFANDTKTIPHSNINQYKIKDLKSHISMYGNMLMCVLISAVFAIVLPEIMGAVGIFGHYLYKTEYLFCAVLWLHLIFTYYIRYGSIVNIRKIINNKLLLGLVASVVLFVILLFAISPFGLLFEVVSNPAPYFIASFLPTAVFICTMEFLPFGKKTK